VAQGPRRPRGIYAVVDTENLINLQQQANPSITTAQLYAYFNTLYQQLLSNPAVSGLTLQVHWDRLNPNAPPASAQILAGIQVDKSFADFVVPDSSDTPIGCTLPASCTDATCVPAACIPQACLAPGVTTAALASYKIFPNVPPADLLSPEQALYNLLNIYFNGSPAASSFSGTQGTTPLNYLQLYSQDIQYASASVNAPDR